MSNRPATPSDPANPAPTPPPSRRRWIGRKQLLIAAASLVGILILLTVGVYFYVRTGRANTYITNEIKKALKEYGLRAEIGGFQYTWDNRTVRLSDVKLHNDQTNQLIAKFDQLELVAEIRDLYALRLRREVVLKTLNVNNLELYWEVDKTGKSNITGLKQPPPRAPSRINIDQSTLTSAINGGKLYINDQAKQIVGELNNLQVKAAPIPGANKGNVEFSGDNGRINLSGRELVLQSVSLATKFDDKVAQLDRINVRTPIGEININGNIEYAGSPVGYDLNLQVRTATKELTAIIPEVKVRGVTEINGKVTGKGENYQLTGAITSDEIAAGDARLLGLRISGINVQPLDQRIDQIAINAQETRAQVARTKDAGLSNVAISNLKANISNGRIELSAPQIVAGNLVAANNRLNNIRLRDLKGSIVNEQINLTAEQVAVGNLALPDGQVNGITINNLVAEARNQNFQARGGLALASGQLRGATLGQTSGDFVATNEQVTVNNFKAALLGGNASGNLAIALQRGTSRVQVDFNNLNTAELLNVAAVKNVPVTGNVSGNAQLSFPGLNAARFSGAVNAKFAGQTTIKENENIPLNGDVAIKADNGNFQINQLKLVSDATTITASGQLVPQGNSDLKFSLVSTRAEQLQRLADSFGLITEQVANLKPQLDGNLSVSGSLTGPLKNPTVNAAINVGSLGLDSKTIGALSANLLISPTEIRVENGQLNAPNGGNATFSYVSPREQTATGGRLDAVFTNINIESVSAGLPVGQFVKGNVNGEAHLTNLPGMPQGRVSINLKNALLAGQQTDNAQINLVLDGQTARLEQIDLDLPQGRVRASGQLDLQTKDFRLQGSADQIDLAKLAATEPPGKLQLSGTANASFQVIGNVTELSKINIDITAEGQNVVINNRPAGQLRITASTDANGKINAEVFTELAGKLQTLRATVDMRGEGLPITVETDLVDFQLDPLVATFAPNLANVIGGKVTGILRANGPILNDEGDFSVTALRGNLTLTAVALTLSGNPINVETPVTVALNQSQVTIDRLRFSGEGVDLTVGGKLGLQGGAGLNFALNGAVDLNPFSAISANLFLDGAISLNAQLGGTFSAPKLTGEIRLRDISFSTLDSPVAIEQGNGVIRLTGDRAVLENFTARANGGTLQANGAVNLNGLNPSNLRVMVMTSDVDVIYQGAVATANASLILTGGLDELELGGRVVIVSAEYTTNFDLGNLAGGSGGGLAFSDLSGNLGGGKSSLPRIRLNISIDAPNSIIIRNEQLRTVASAALTIGGTLTNPDITGRISLEGGTVKFRGQRYDITTGTLELPGGIISPIANVLAEGDVAGYHVYIGLTGPIDQLDLSFRADPDLTRAEVISLITTGRTQAGSVNSDSLASTGIGTAASLLTNELISKPFGRGAEQLLGLNRFQLDPIIRPNANPAARLTVGRQISRDLTLTYSTSLASEQDQTLILEYSISNRFSAIGSFTQGGSSTRGGSSDNDFGIDIRGRERFSFGGGVKKDVGDPNSRNTINALTTFARPPLPTAEVLLEKPENIDISKSRQDELLPIRRQGFSLALARLGQRNLLNYLQEKGYFFADTRFNCDPADCNGPNLKVTYNIEPGLRYDLQEIRITGTELISKSEISAELESQEQSDIASVPVLKSLPLLGGYARGLTSNDRLRNDRELIRRKMADLGFRQARVDSRLAIDPMQNDHLVVIFDVEEGPRSNVTEIELRGITTFTMPELTNELTLKEGEAFSLTKARESAQQIKNFYATKGYLDTTVEPTAEDIDDNHLRLIYSVTEGNQAVVREIELTGQDLAKEGSIRRFFAFGPGDVLTPALIQRTQRDLYATGNFREVSIRHEPMSELDQTARRVIVKVTENKPLLLVYGLGYSTEEGPRGLIELTHTNLFGQLNTGSMRVRGSRREQLFQMTYTDLRPLGSKWPVTVSAFYNRNSNLRSFTPRQLDGSQSDDADNNTFGIRRFAAFVQTEHKLDNITSIRFRYNFENAKLFNLDNVSLIELTRNERATRLGILSAGISRDTRDNILNPTRGQLISADQSVAARIFGGNESFNKFFTNFQRYQQFPSLNNSVIAIAARIGLAAPFRVQARNPNGIITDSDRQLPISERFFAGGATTLRGFQFEEAGPQVVLEPRNEREGPTLVPIGGDALVVLNFEFRYPITSRLQLVPFYDLGNVFPRVRDINFSRMTNSIGLGLRFNTPIGPVGIEYGYLLDPPKFVTASGGVLRQRRGVIHIRLGQSF